jgi:hypothetical protein
MDMDMDMDNYVLVNKATTSVEKTYVLSNK